MCACVKAWWMPYSIHVQVRDSVRDLDLSFHSGMEGEPQDLSFAERVL